MTRPTFTFWHLAIVASLPLSACMPQVITSPSGTVLSIETAAGGTGSPVTLSTLQDGLAVPLFAVIRSKTNKYIGDASSVTWSASPPGLGVVSVTSSSSATFTPTAGAGSIVITAVDSHGSAATPRISLLYSVTSIPGLAFWGKGDSLLGNTNGTSIGVWPDSSHASSDAIQALPAYQPLYESNVLNGKPVLRFDGTNSRLSFPGTVVVNTDYTIFAVGARTSGAHESMFLGGTTSAARQNLAFGYRQDSGGFMPLTFNLAHYASDVWGAVPSYSGKTFEFWTGVFSQVSGESIFRNGISFASDASRTLTLTSAAGTMIGYWPLVSSGYQGDIAEIIVYGRALGSTEQGAVESYLRVKYGL